MNLRDITRNFIINEGHNPPSLASYIQSLQEILTNLSPSSQTEMRRLDIARNHIREIKRHVKKLEEQVKVLEEQLNESRAKELKEEK
jgi:hypothetical protein